MPVLKRDVYNFRMVDREDAVQIILARAWVLADLERSAKVELDSLPNDVDTRENLLAAIDYLLSKGDDQTEIEIAMIQLLTSVLRDRSTDIPPGLNRLI